MNLGDQENVIIVTGCMRGAFGPAPREREHVRQLQRVAAPARDVLSTASGAKYTKGSGTSQATAFVAVCS